MVTGINEGQNVGPLVDVSGTVGAARAAVAHGVPALASSQGLGKTFDYPTGVEYVTEWVEEHRDELVDGSAEVQVTNMNIPSCDTGEVHGAKEVAVEHRWRERHQAAGLLLRCDAAERGRRRLQPRLGDDLGRAGQAARPAGG